MKSNILLLLALISAVFADSDLEQWQRFKSTHGKLYSNHVEEIKRFNIFQSNLRRIEEHNAKYEAGKVTWFKAVNQFTDLTQEEFSSWLRRSYGNGTNNFKPQYIHEASPDANVPESFDWREHGAVTPVKDQGDCGSCWSFATTGALEGAYFVHSNRLESFSEQQLVDCSQSAPYSMGGCNGGWAYVGIQYAADYGIETESVYPFAGVNQPCQYSASKVVTKVRGYVGVTPKDAIAMKQAIALEAPAAIAIDADYIFDYGGGIYESTKCTNCDSCLNHEVLAVGYKTENGVDYWIIKNSWTETWGEKGYIRMRRGINMCGVELSPIYATY